MVPPGAAPGVRVTDVAARLVRVAGAPKGGDQRFVVAEGDRIAHLEGVEPLHVGAAEDVFEEAGLVLQRDDARGVVDGLDGERLADRFANGDGILRQRLQPG